MGDILKQKGDSEVVVVMMRRVSHSVHLRRRSVGLERNMGRLTL
jgi:hypothetical protein